MACYLLEIPVVQLTGIRSLGVELFENWCGMIKLPGIKLKCKLESKRWLNECECQLKIFIPDFVLTKVWVRGYHSIPSFQYPMQTRLYRSCVLCTA